MQQIQDFFQVAFEVISTSFPDATIEYKQSDFTKSHIVKITPPALLDSEDFIKIEGNLYKRWRQIDTEEDFGIVTEDAIIDTSGMKIVYKPSTPYQVTISFDSDQNLAEVISIDVEVERVKLLSQDFQISTQSTDFIDDEKYGMAA